MPAAPSAPRRILIDCDPGIDDALALLLALRSPELHVEAVTVVAGNVPVDRGAANALRLVELAGRPEVPVARGARRPLLRQPITGEAIHGENGLGGVIFPEPSARLDPRHAVDLLIDAVTAHPGEVTLVAIAPLTNVALAVLKEPAIAGLIPEIILMGGSLGAGNLTAAAEYNVFADAEAARIVFNSGIPITMLQLTATCQAVLTRRHLAEWNASGSPLAAAAAAMADHYLRVYERRGLPGGHLHDPLAVGLAIDRTLALESERLRIEIETRGEFTDGATVADRRPGRSAELQPNADVPLRIDGDRFVRMLAERLSTPPR
jgi:purine nucleosidase